jgi:hypothetical protein
VKVRATIYIKILSVMVDVLVPLRKDDIEIVDE